MTLVLLHAFPLDERMWEPLGRDDAVAPRLYEPERRWTSGPTRCWSRSRAPFSPAGLDGGYCALAIARRAPERLTGLVLTGARLGRTRPTAARAGPTRSSSSIRTALGLWDDMLPKVFPEAAPEAVELARDIALEQPADDLVRGVEAIRDRPDSSSVVTSLDVPVLMAVSEHDPFFSLEEALAETPGGLRGRRALSSMERPEEFNGLLDELL